MSASLDAECCCDGGKFSIDQTTIEAGHLFFMGDGGDIESLGMGIGHQKLDEDGGDSSRPGWFGLFLLLPVFLSEAEHRTSCGRYIETGE